MIEGMAEALTKGSRLKGLDVWSFGCVATVIYGGFAAWRMTEQPTVVLSATEAELVELLLNASQRELDVRVQSKESQLPCGWTT